MSEKSDPEKKKEEKGSKMKKKSSGGKNEEDREKMGGTRAGTDGEMGLEKFICLFFSLFERQRENLKREERWLRGERESVCRER